MIRSIFRWDNEDLSNLPKTLIVVGEYDFIRVQAEKDISYIVSIFFSV